MNLHTEFKTSQNLTYLSFLRPIQEYSWKMFRYGFEYPMNEYHPLRNMRFDAYGGGSLTMISGPCAILT